MRYMQRKNAHKLVRLLVVFFVLVGLLAGVISASIPIDTGQAAKAETISNNQNNDIQAVSIMTANATEKMYVYDNGENKLLYNRVTGMVFSNAGVVYTSESKPLTYNDETQEFEDSLQRRLDLVERSTGGLQNYYLMFGEYKVRSIGIKDTLYIVGVAANTAYNSGAAYDMLITRVWVTNPWYLQMLGRRGYYEYYDLNGHEIDDKYLEYTRKPNLIAGSGTSALGGTKLTKFEKWGTIKDLLDEIVYLMELVPPTGSPMGEFALDTVTGAYLRDDRNQKVRIAETGQLIDPMGWALIGSDARPLWWKEEIRAYTNHKGELLNVDSEYRLVDSNGFIAHSVISNVLAGTRIYIFYLADGVTTIPVTLKTISTDPYKAEYYDMNGNKIDLSEIVEPEISVDDRQDNWSDEFYTWFDGVKGFFDSLIDGITNFINVLKNIFSGIWGFVSNFWYFILLGIAVILAIIFIPPVLSFVMFIIKIIFKLLSAIFKAIIKILTFPFRIFRGNE